MTRDPFEDTQENVFVKLEEGMPVYDRNDKKVGKVRHFQSGLGTADEPGESGELPADAPLELRQRLIGGGFVKIDRGLLSSDRYAELDHVEAVSEEGVRLNVAKDELLKL